ncbi:MAG: YbdD/YjiX family protein [Gemmatimonadales bacterium]
MIHRLEVALAGIARAMRAMLGAPDYERYVAHVRHSHADREPLSREQFMKERLESRYSRPGARCC